MIAPTDSYLKVSYDLRPAKQVERRMFIDALQRLALAGVPLSQYQYTGLGSIYFVDFILFHKLLGIEKLLSVEHDTKIAKRIEFNRPFRQVEVAIKPISEIIPLLSRDRKHIIWLDYDDIIQASHVEDLISCGDSLSCGSIVLVTIDSAHPDGAGPSEWRKHFEEQVPDYLGRRTQDSDFALSELPRVNAEIMERAITRGLAARKDVEFLPLFGFVYADGHEMVTIGGIVGGEQEKLQISASGLHKAVYYRDSVIKPPFRIRVPSLTRKERLHLDRSMPCDKDWTPKEFELPAEDIAAYSDIYRFFPAYAELLL
jgi:hypothetical protein